jgi:hypothetical protein
MKGGRDFGWKNREGACPASAENTHPDAFLQQPSGRLGLSAL